MVMVEDPDTGNRIWCEITDRGPYAVMEPSGQRKAVGPRYALKSGERWHGFLDMSAAAAKRLGTYDEGLFRARIRYWVPKVESSQRLAYVR